MDTSAYTHARGPQGVNTPPLKSQTPTFTSDGNASIATPGITTNFHHLNIAASWKDGLANWAVWGKCLNQKPKTVLVFASELLSSKYLFKKTIVRFKEEENNRLCKALNA